MLAIRPGDRGPAVEDIQRRLRALGFDVGPTGIDGVFLGRTLDAVRAFQERAGLPSDGVVDDATWSALVDATFRLGDRVLYLRIPHLHGADVRLLQEALTVLGFAPGVVDAIFGVYTERAVREFQRNAALPADGIVGAETVSALFNLRHVWEGKEARAHSGATKAAVRSEAVLARLRIAVSGADPEGESVARRIVNLAHATSPDAGVRLLTAEQAPDEGELALRLRSEYREPAPAMPLVRYVPDDDAVAARVLTAVATARKTDAAGIVIEVGREVAHDERSAQRAAVAILDALCDAFD